MLEALKKEVYEANLQLPRYGLVLLTWGNVSAIDRSCGAVVIKPSGVDYSLMTPEDMVVTDLNGNILEGRYRPSSDLPSHLVLYKAFREIGSIVHTHSPHATAFAQSQRDLPCYGTTHADYYFGDVPCTRQLTVEEVNGAYETQTGQVIVETFKHRKLDPMAIPAVLVSKHGPFTWGVNSQKAVENSVVLEECARMALMSEDLNHNIVPAPKYLLSRHYRRKHGAGAYYGQK